MIEEQVDVVIFVVDGDPFLASDKGKVSSHLENECFQFFEDRVFNILFDVSPAQPEKVKKVRIAEDHVGR